MADQKEAKAVSDAVAKALDQLGPLATATLLERELAGVRRVQHDGQFPRAYYGKDGQVRVVESKAEAEALGKGWGETPSDAHRDRQNSGAVAENQSRVEAELAVQRAKYLADPADSTAHSALHGSGVMVGAETTMSHPLISQSVAAGAEPQPAPDPAPEPKPAPVAPEGEKK